MVKYQNNVEDALLGVVFVTKRNTAKWSCSTSYLYFTGRQAQHGGFEE